MRRFRATLFAGIIAASLSLLGCPEPSPPIVPIAPVIDHLPADTEVDLDPSEPQVDEALYALDLQSTALFSLERMGELRGEASGIDLGR